MERIKKFCLNWLSWPIVLCGFYAMCTYWNIPSIMMFILGAVMCTKCIMDYGYNEFDAGKITEKFFYKYNKELYDHGHNNEDTFTISLSFEYDKFINRSKYAVFECDKNQYCISDVVKNDDNIKLTFRKIHEFEL